MTRLLLHVWRFGHNIDDHRPHEPEGQRHEHAQRQRPIGGQHRRAPHPRHSRSTKRLPHQRFGCKGKSVKRIACDVQKLQQDLVRRQSHIAKAPAQQQKRHKDTLQQKRADQNIAVHHSHPLELDTVKHPRPIAPSRMGKRRAAHPQPKHQP